MNKIKDKIKFNTPVIEIPKKMIIETKKGKKKLKKTLTTKNNLASYNKEKAIKIINTNKDEINIINPGDKIKVNVKVNKKDEFKPEKLEYLDLKDEIKKYYKDLNNEQIDYVIEELIKNNFNKDELDNNIKQQLRGIELSIPIRGVNNNQGVGTKFKNSYLKIYNTLKDIYNKINLNKYQHIVQLDPKLRKKDNILREKLNIINQQEINKSKEEYKKFLENMTEEEKLQRKKDETIFKNMKLRKIKL